VLVTVTAGGRLPQPSSRSSKSSRRRSRYRSSTRRWTTSFHDLARDSLKAGQIDYQEGILEPGRAAMLKGRVIDSEGEPLAGATVTVVGRGELGHTEMDAKGEYVLSIDATGAMTVEIT
jgi:hypothetical protein